MTIPFKVVATEFEPWIWELKLEGSIDMSNYSKVDEALKGVFERGASLVIVNLQRVQYISSTGFGCFLGYYNPAAKEPKWFVFTQVPPAVKRVFDSLGLGGILEFAPSSEAAAALLRQKVRKSLAR